MSSNSSVDIALRPRFLIVLAVPPVLPVPVVPKNALSGSAVAPSSGIEPSYLGGLLVVEDYYFWLRLSVILDASLPFIGDFVRCNVNSLLVLT